MSWLKPEDVEKIEPNIILASHQESETVLTLNLIIDISKSEINYCVFYDGICFITTEHHDRAVNCFNRNLKAIKKASE